MLRFRATANEDGSTRYRIDTSLAQTWCLVHDTQRTEHALFVRSPSTSGQFAASSLNPNRIWDALNRGAFGQLPLLLGLEYALIAFDPHAAHVYLSRGGVGRTALYFRWDDEAFVVHDDLPRPSASADIDGDAFAAFLANCASPVPNDIVHTSRTLLSGRGWHRAVRAAVTQVSLRDRCVTLRHYQLPEDEPYRDLSDEDLMAAYRDAVLRNLATHAVGPSAVELSGGIDSTIVAVGLESVAPGAGHFGVSLVYPYYEFRHERRYIDAVNERLRWTPTLVDGSRTLLFDPAAFAFDTAEPTRLSSGYAQLAAVTAAALARGAKVLFNGHGADQIFGMSPYDRQSLFKSRIELDLLYGPLSAQVRDHIAEMRRVHEDGDPRGHRHFFSALMLYDRWVPAPDGEQLDCAPVLLSVDTLRLSWEALRRPPWRDSGYPAKRFAREAFAAWLPQPVRERRWKVGYDGLYRRGLARNADRLIARLEHNRDHLETLGIDTRRCIQRVERCKTFHFDHMELLIGILSYCVWRDTRTRTEPLSDAGDAARS